MQSVKKEGDDGAEMGVSATQLEQTHMVGTPLYMAPEMIVETKHYGTAVDVYSFSVMLWYVVV